MYADTPSPSLWNPTDNLFGDRILNLELFDRQLYEWQSAWYHTRKEEYGVPLDTRHAWTKVGLSFLPLSLGSR